MPDEHDDVVDGLFDLKLSALLHESPEYAQAATLRLTSEAQDMMDEQRRRSPFISHSGVQDVTQNFIAASKQLQSGELIKDEHFTLFEAVGALEIMDPKMDSGFVESGDAFDPDWKVIDQDDIDGSEALWIMDELLRMEVLFHEGYPLSQNVFTSLHVFRLIDPSNSYPYPLSMTMRKLSLTQNVLRTYCLGVIKSCQLVLDCIQSQTYYEEEDFVTHLYGRELCPDKSVEEVTEELSNIITQLLADCKKDGTKFEIGLAIALIQRLEIRYHMLCALERNQDLGQTMSYWTRLQDQFNQITSNHSLTRPLPSAFSDKVQRQLASSTPPRPMPQISWEEARRKWIYTCDDVLAAHAAFSVDVAQRPHRLKSALWAFSGRSPTPATYARAKLQEVLTADEKVAGEVSHFDLMLADLRELVLPEDPLAETESFLIEAPHDIRHRTSRIIEDFMIKSFGEYLNLYRTICQNRDRCRRLLTQTIVLFDELETLALETDDQVLAITSPRFTSEKQTEVFYPIWSWTRMHKLRIVQWSAQLGFESDLYQSDGIYHMYDLLASVFAQKERLTTTIVSSATVQAKDQKRCGPRGEQPASIQRLVALQKTANAESNLATVLATFWDYLSRLGLLPAAEERPYYNEQRQYEARMKPFLRMTYQVVPTLEQLRKCKADRATHLCTPARLQSHLEAMLGFRKDASMQQPILEELKFVKSVTPKEDSLLLEELRSLEATCWAVKIALSQLVETCKGIGKEHETARDLSLTGRLKARLPEVKERKHPWWLVPKITGVVAA